MSDCSSSPEPWFPGIDGPNFTMHPNALYDAVMPMVSHAEWKVICLIVRRTKGWHEELADISLAEIVDGTGVVRSTVALALRSLVAQGILTSKPNFSADGGRLPSTYGLRHKPKGGSDHRTGGLVRSSDEGPSDDRTALPIEERNPEKETEAGRAWKDVLDQLATEMTRTNFETYFSDTYGVAISETDLVVRVPPRLTIALERFLPLIRRATRSVTLTRLEIRFTSN